MITLDKIRNILLEEIERSEIKKTELAERIGVSHQAISEYFKGRAMPALDTFAKICAVLDLDANEILCVKDYAEK